MTQQCPVFGKCGGCSTQHIPYEVQLENKKKQLVSASGFEDVKAFSSEPYGYRNRMDLIFHEGGLGFRFKGKWWKVQDIEQCPISNPRLNELIKEVRDFFKSPDYFDLKKHSGTFRYAVVRTPGEDSSISFVLNSESTRLGDATEKIKEFAKNTTSNNILITRVPPNSDLSISQDFFVVKGTEMLQETYLNKKFQYHAQGFFQNNSAMAESMQAYVHNLLRNQDTKDANLLDLYGGVGTFGIINADLFKEILIVEGDEQCIQAANKNIESNSVMNATAKLLDAKHLNKLELHSPLFVITDPPRSGMHPKTLEELKVLLPKVLIYVSCNVKELEKDLNKLSDYEIKSTALFDFFPQTPHSESVIELVRKN
ncbi:MAG: 23S rRNA (uracil(1939)-C(5))-methyltransferase RlmD [Nanoarchaeota archaeon]|nr:23S rRNA (uracil(1939)-C(5))-methyltransferase RlmD [Nanoarchaeota archaeon]